MKLTNLIVILVLSIFYSCKKDKDPKAPDPVIETTNTMDLLQYKTGNYWVYQVTYTPEDTANSSVITDNDSIIVAGDTVIMGNTYKVIIRTEGNDVFSYFYRDSSGFLIDNIGQIFFSSKVHNVAFNHYSNVYKNDTIHGHFDIIDGSLKSISMPAGDFKAYNRMRFNFYNGPTERIERKTITAFAPGTGIVYYEKFYIGSKHGSVIGRLLRYKV